jgi:hypothetical protein
LYKLAENPVKFSRPSAPPAEIPGYQVYEFWLESDLTGRWRIAILFKYGQNERDLHIYVIGRAQYHSQPDSDDEPF